MRRLAYDRRRPRLIVVSIWSDSMTAQRVTNALLAVIAVSLTLIAIRLWKAHVKFGRETPAYFFIVYSIDGQNVVQRRAAKGKSRHSVVRVLPLSLASKNGAS